MGLSLSNRTACSLIFLLIALASSPLAAADEAAGGGVQAADADGRAKKGNSSPIGVLHDGCAACRREEGLGFVTVPGEEAEPVFCCPARLCLPSVRTRPFRRLGMASPVASWRLPRRCRSMSDAQRADNAFADPFEDDAQGKVVTAGATTEATSPQVKPADDLAGQAPPSMGTCPRFQNR